MFGHRDALCAFCWLCRAIARRTLYVSTPPPSIVGSRCRDLKGLRVQGLGRRAWGLELREMSDKPQTLDPHVYKGFNVEFGVEGNALAFFESLPQFSLEFSLKKGVHLTWI
jgi:hypothetical protein